MAFKKIPGFPGQIYIPDESTHQPKKNNCPDCYGCQMCSDERCRLCNPLAGAQPRECKQHGFIEKKPEQGHN